MRIGIACGGTGGHIFPGLATAEVLRRRGHDVILWLAGKDVEPEAMAGWEGPVVTIQADSVATLFSLRNAGILWRLIQAIQQCRRMMKSDRPDVLLAMGSYASVAPVVAAKGLGIPVILHEANVIPGRAIRFLSRWAAAVAVGFEETRRYLKHRRLVLTGMPLRKDSLPRHSPEAKAGERLAVSREPLAMSSSPWRMLKPDRFTVLIMGGSRGAHTLNERASAAVVHLHWAGKNIQVIHLTGMADEAAIRQRYEQAGVAHAVFGFLHDMAQAYQRASLVICRSGASTCAELAWQGLPALLVPYPFATHQHQLANACALEKAGAADLREEPTLTVEWLADYISAQMADPDRLERMSQAARRRNTGDAAEALADLVEQVGRKY